MGAQGGWGDSQRVGGFCTPASRGRSGQRRGPTAMPRPSDSLFLKSLCWAPRSRPALWSLNPATQGRAWGLPARPPRPRVLRGTLSVLGGAVYPRMWFTGATAQRAGGTSHSSSGADKTLLRAGVEGPPRGHNTLIFQPSYRRSGIVGTPCVTRVGRGGWAHCRGGEG